MLPYVVVVITPQGTQHIASFWDEAGARQYVEKYRKNYVEQFSVVGKGMRGCSSRFMCHREISWQ